MPASGDVRPTIVLLLRSLLLLLAVLGGRGLLGIAVLLAGRRREILLVRGRGGDRAVGIGVVGAGAVLGLLLLMLVLGVVALRSL